MSKQIPFTVIGGFLGAGKTSLVNQLLRNATARYAILVNDFGTLNIDQNLIAKHNGDTIALANGCICCSLAAGFSQGLGQVLDRIEQFDHLIVEASGVANPQRIQDIAKIEAKLQARGNVVLADASQLRQQAEDPHIGSLIRRQINAADFLLINKQSLVDESEKRAIIRYLEQVCEVPYHFTDWSQVEPERVLQLKETSVKPINLLQSEPEDHGLFSKVIKTDDKISRGQFERWSHKLSPDVLRGKGFIRFSDREGVWLWQKVAAQQQLSLSDQMRLTSHNAELLLIGKNRDSLVESIS